MADLTTLANVKSWLKIEQSTDDELLKRTISAVSEWIQRKISRTIAQGSVTEVRDGTGGNVLLFRNFPVTAVASVIVDGVSIPSAPDSTSPGYRFDTKKLWLQGSYYFKAGMGNVQLTYTAGYAEVPGDIEQATIDIVSLLYRSRDRIGHASKSINGETVAFITKEMPDSARDIIQSYESVILI